MTDQAPANGTIQGNLLRLVPSREGHFQFESGHHGNLWLDLDALFLKPRSIARIVATLAHRLAKYEIQMVCGPLVGGAFVAQMIALEMDIEFCFSERVVHPSAEDRHQVEYRLPRGLWAEIAGKRIAMVDDAINAGSAVGGALAAVRSAGAVPVVVAALLDLRNTRTIPPTFEGLPLVTLVNWPAHLWLPDVCPLCAARIPLERLGDD
ncbi:MAG: orotate phosphoribosyltransferase [Chloroflexota bacterium]|nr:orotate phosphoribosyltransferase [Chloroflexota bacterium]